MSVGASAVTVKMLIHGRLILMEGGTEKTYVSSGGKAWDAEQLGSVMATEIFGTRHRGMRFDPSP